MTLLLIAFIAGVLTVLAPCVLPLLPIIVGGTVSGGENKKRAYTVAISLGLSVILFTLVLKFSTALIGIPQYAWWWISGGILIIFGIITVFPEIWDRIGFVNLLNRESNQLMSRGFMQQSFWGDVLVGAALGPVFSTCSPTYFVILATVLPTSFAEGFVDLLAYTVGLVLMLLLIGLVGQRVVDRLGVASDPRGWFRRGIGVLFLVVGLAVATGYEQPIEAWLIEHVYDITKIEQKLLDDRQKQAGTSSLQCRDGRCFGPDASSSAATSTGSEPTVLSQVKKSMMYQKSPELAKIDGYINTGGIPVSIGEFRGKKVVLIDFWTYSCINCQRTLPYLRSWYEKYKDQGLEIIGVHTPEFAFEHLQANVENAVRGFGLKYPIVLDNSYGTWGAFSNQYWPRKYLIDIDGYVVYDHAGEGNYDETEVAIQKALKERNERLGITAQLPALDGVVGAEAVDQLQVGSPEVYFGAARNEYLENGAQGVPGPQNLTMSERLDPNKLYLSGKWNFDPEFAETQSDSAQIKFFYKAKEVYFVARSAAPIRIKITRDGGQNVGDARGEDVDADGYVTVKEDRLYKLIRDSAYGPHILEMKAEGKGLQAYTFTFG